MQSFRVTPDAAVRQPDAPARDTVRRVVSLVSLAYASGWCWCWCVVLLGCSGQPSQPAVTSSITLATTTSARDSGLLDVLAPRFREQTGIEVKVVAVGSGQALELARRGDADVLLTHSPAAEQKFVDEGFGIERREVMHNDFVIVGPPSDPAGVKGESSVSTALALIANAQSPFVSRGDESGTHVMEKQLWSTAVIEPRGDWYIEAGAGMAEVLRMASEKRAYTLCDRGTYLAQRPNLELKILSSGDPQLVNRYSVILVNPEKQPGANAQGARKFADFLLSEETQAAIARFGVDKYGEPLFFPRQSR